MLPPKTTSAGEGLEVTHHRLQLPKMSSSWALLGHGMECCTLWRPRLCILVSLHNCHSATFPLRFQWLPLGTGVHVDKLGQLNGSEGKAGWGLAGKAVVCESFLAAHHRC